MGGGTGNGPSKEFSRLMEAAEQTRERSPRYLKDFEMPLLADEADKLDIAENVYSKKFFQTFGTTYHQYIVPQVKNCPSRNVKFIVECDETVLEGTFEKKYFFSKPIVSMRLKGRCHHNPPATEEAMVLNGDTVTQTFKLVSFGTTVSRYNEDGTIIEGPIRHSTVGVELRLLNHLLYIEDALKNNKAKVEVSPLFQ